MVILYPVRASCFHLGTSFEPTAAITLVAALALTACIWMGKWFYRMSRQVMDERLALDFIRQMMRRFGIATPVQIAAIPVAVVAPRAGVAIAMLCLAFFLLPQPRPRDKPGEEPDIEEITSE